MKFYTVSRTILSVIAAFLSSNVSADDILEFPDMEQGVSLNAESHSDVISVRYGNLDYMPSHSFYNLPELEEIVFDGIIGHIDGYMIENCPKLKRVVFNGPILSTGGEVFASKCPNLTDIEVNGLAFRFYLTENPDCPQVEKISVNGAVVVTGDTAAVSTTSLSELKKNPEMLAQLKSLADWQIKNMPNKDFRGQICKGYESDMRMMLDSLGFVAKAMEFDSAFIANRGDFGKTKLQILKESAPYSKYTGDENLTVHYAAPTDSMLIRSREYFNLDSIAGNGDDISKIKNLLYWIHDLVRHDGSSAWPDCKFNLIDLYNVCREQNRGLNCRFMAIMLTEALLAEEIPARYLTCQSKDYANDSDCHVITVAWSDSFGKWVWVDPTFAAYVTDENGLMLHPGEVRYRLQSDLPIILNEDANWNHQQSQTKDYYLDQYMAKNLYVISSNLLQQSEPEGATSHPTGKVCALVPTDFEFNNAHYVISDENLFWAAPSR